MIYSDEVLAAEVAERLAGVLGLPATPPPGRVSEAADAAVVLARRYIYDAQLPGSETPLPTSDEAPDLFLGLVTLAGRVYHDPASPGGVVASDAFIGAAIPEDLLGHVRHYLAPFKVGFGVA